MPSDERHERRGLGGVGGASCGGSFRFVREHCKCYVIHYHRSPMITIAPGDYSYDSTTPISGLKTDFSVVENRSVWAATDH